MSSIKQRRSKVFNNLLPWLDVIAITAWGFLMLKYWLTQQLYLLIHPNYFALVVVAGIGLIIVGIAKGGQLLQQREAVPNVQHMNLIPPRLGSILLIAVAILGFFVAPQVFASDKALQRGVTDLSSGNSRLQPQSFRTSVRPEERSLVDWSRTLSVYPEPDAYTGQKVKVTGFVIYPPDLGNEYLFLARFVLTCCAADAYPVGLPIKLKEGQSREEFKKDSWLEIEGKMGTETLTGKRQLTIISNSAKQVPQPKNPYSY
ncbi:TIGR03943 family putative permease subunit [Rivularia sp. UHCC 0363]|uniref:TIGR03943 family putative permease subunit n=1 Tax=Rivularia sp. UHCC 0363 TaxID=3110244 RepID=UPI002B215CBA|nr:TIGR03943 family protein [Rivularia sp. UHCC 0363]MEA5596109.1 TIGR03943 family protein [Rivularia sp. UHCC 0363]